MRTGRGGRGGRGAPAPRRAALALASALSASAIAAPARAQTGSEQAAAEALFREARALFKARKIAPACTKFAESQRLDPKLGTLLNLASCHEQEGKTATAWAEFTQAAGMAVTARNQARADYARSHASDLERKLSRVIFRGPPEASAIEGLRIKLGDKELAAAAIGSKIPLDPGKYPIEVTAPGKKGWSSEIDVPAGPASIEVDIPPLADEPKPPPAPRPQPAAQAAPDAPSPSGEGGSGAQRTLGLVVGGVGLVGLGVGAYFGIRTFGQQSIVEENCQGSLCNQEGFDADQDAHTSATVSTVAFAAGGALLAGGVVLFLTASDGPAAPDAAFAAPRLWLSPRVGLAGADLSVGGAW